MVSDVLSFRVLDFMYLVENTLVSGSPLSLE